jgi:hypothetical protein
MKNFDLENSRLHFITRLSERYGIVITEQEYNNLLEENDLKVIFKRNYNASIGTITIQRIKVWVIYSCVRHLFTTAIPKSIEIDINELFYACFSKPVRNVANELYQLILIELNNERKDFDSKKDAAIYYYEHCSFSDLLIEKFKHGNVRPIKICHVIKKIIEGTHERVKFGLIPKP